MEKLDVSVLIIDDNEMYCKKLEIWLRDIVSKVQVSYTAEQGSHFVATIKPDLIFLDNQLPKLNGLDVVSLYNDVSPDSKVILMSGLFNQEEIAEAMSGTCDYVFNKEEITREKIEELLKVYEEASRKDESIWNIFKLFKSRK